MQQSAKFWDKAAAKYAKSSISDLDAYNKTLALTRSYLSPTDKVLEVGCGTGSTALLLADGVEHITASDLSGSMIKIASEKAQDQGVHNVSFVTADLLDASMDNGPYDAVLALNVLHLLEDSSGAIRRINGALKSGGIFVSKTFCPYSKGASLKFRLIKFILPLMQLLGKAPYVNFMTFDELESLITAGGFEIIEAENYPPPSRYVVARKVEG